MRFIFRADASREIGSGHVMRSSVLAEEAIARGYECIFVGEITNLDWVSERISTLGFSQILTSEQSFVSNTESDVLILDSYSISVSTAFIAKGNWKLVMAICDEITPKYAADIELRPGMEKLGEAKHSPVVLTGPEYVLIRKGIVKSVPSKDAGGRTKVLVVGGGSDPFEFVPAVLEKIRSLNLDLEVHAFTNGEYTSWPRVNLVVHPVGSELDLVANDVDVVLTTASTSSLEFIAREIPTGVVCAVDNQENYYEKLGQLGYASQIGIRNPNDGWEFNIEAIRELMESQEKRRVLTETIKGLIDLKGAQRVIDYLISHKPF